MKRLTSYVLLFFIVGCTLQNFTATAQDSPTQSIEPLLDLEFTKAERDSLFRGLQNNQRTIKAIHEYVLSNSVGMSMQFNPLPQGFSIDQKQNPIAWGLPINVKVPANQEDLAFYTVAQLSVLIKSKKIRLIH